MKKRNGVIFALSLCLLTGCSNETSKKKEPTGNSKDGKTYEQLVTSVSKPSSYSVQVNRSDDMRYEQDSIQTYDLSAALEINEKEKQGHLSMELYSNGMESRLDGWYFDDRFYANYNNVSYYQDMTLNQMEDLVLVPLSFNHVDESEVKKWNVSTNEKNQTIVEMELNEKGLKKYFAMYDAYGFEQQSNFEIKSGKMIQTFEQDGTWVKEETDFLSHLTQEKIGVDIQTKTSVSFYKQNETMIRFNHDQKEKMKQYVNYKDIDTSKISPYDPSVDSKENTVVDTFKKRLVNRLNYEAIKPNIYKTTFNENESYEIDFEHHLFTYRNHSISYVYNWKGDVGGYGSSCSLDFKKDTYTSDCDKDVLKMIRNVKLFFEMELYYCDLSLDALAKEA